MVHYIYHYGSGKRQRKMGFRPMRIGYIKKSFTPMRTRRRAGGFRIIGRRKMSKRQARALAMTLGIFYILSLITKYIDLITTIALVALSIVAVALLVYLFAKYNKVLSAETNQNIINFIDVINPFYKKRRRYKKSEYYKQTHLPYKELKSDTGKVGEYEIFNTLFSYNDKRKFLFNCYLPKGDGETTEIDVIMIHSSGIYVFESKNYSGWIFGNETHQEWTQTLMAGKNQTQRFHFFNPIMQNNLHIKHLSKYLNDTNIKYHSYIVFGKNCELKNVNVTNPNYRVITISDLLLDVSVQIEQYDDNLSDEQIEEIFNKLYPLTQVSNEVKDEHIKNIIKNH